jgi:membrane-associated protease RseP (regulator of RpoE activity)
VSSDLPEYPTVSSSWITDAIGSLPPAPEPWPAPREWGISILLFGITILTTSFAGLFYMAGNVSFFQAVGATLLRPGLLLLGLPFSVPLVMILLAHEMGHFLACRYYGIRCTPPYFIPVPISIAGTFGAFIKIKSPFPNRRALFDVGIAGPLAGFLFVLPALWTGISLSKLIPRGALGSGALNFGEPLIFRLVGKIALHYSPGKHDMLAHPIAMAAWFGLLATSLNLFPIWQLDGGHIAYAIFGRRYQKSISVAALILLMLVSLLGWPTPPYLLFGLLVLIMGARSRFYHPATLLDEEELGPGRLVLGIVAFVILAVSFTPVPISFT